MTVSLFVLIPAFVLLVIAIILLLTAISIGNTFKSVGEPIFLHVAIIFIFLFLTFLTGSIGVYYSLDETTHPLFLFNVFTISMTYIGVGFVFRNLTQGISIFDEYLQLLLLLAPAYALALMLGLDFAFIPAIISQFIPLIIVLKMDISLFSRLDSSSKVIDQEEDQRVLNTLKNIFLLSRNIHFLGILAMLAFGMLALFGEEIQAQQTWGPTWQPFDYLYFIALLVLLILFVKIYVRVREISENIVRVDFPLIINSLLE